MFESLFISLRFFSEGRLVCVGTVQRNFSAARGCDSNHIAMAHLERKTNR